MKAFLLLLLLLSGVFSISNAERKWTGAIDGTWANPLNWEPSGIPVSTDDVVLDHSLFNNNYTVTLPTTSVTVTSIVITPDAGKMITLVLPSINVTSPALVLTGLSDAFVLNRGGTFRNASGLTSGQSLRMAGNLRINNGGAYIHNTRSAHAADIVAKLSIAEGTEQGVFEFDIPVASSTISLSNRSFGKLKLSAVSYNGNVSYSGGGSNPVTIRSDLEIGERVNFSIGFANVFTIKGSLLQYGGSFNISNDNNPTVVAVGTHIQQLAGQITETGGATPVLLFNGTTKQDILVAGGVMNEVILRMDNAAGAELKSPLSINYRLELRQGKIKTTTATLLTLLDNATLVADSLSASFIDGPLRKQGLNRTVQFLFPVGKSGRQRWVELKNATGNFVVTYKQQNPYDFSPLMDAGLHHVSTLETWTIDADPFPLPEAEVELSFDNMHSGGVSDLQALRVAVWIPGVKWSNRGNQATTGSAGASGSVTSDKVTDFNAEKRLFTLGSSVSNQNTLPDKYISFRGRREEDMILLDWEIPIDLKVNDFVIEGGRSEVIFTPIKTIPASPGKNVFSYHYSNDKLFGFFRIKVNLKNGTAFYSKVIYIERSKPGVQVAEPFVLNSQLNVKVNTHINEILWLELHDKLGRLLFKSPKTVTIGENRIVLQLPVITKDVYFLTIYNRESKQVIKFRN